MNELTDASGESWGMYDGQWGSCDLAFEQAHQVTRAHREPCDLLRPHPSAGE